VLFNQYGAMARAIARREMRRRPAYGLERGDFEQLALSGLLEAIDKFDPLLGAPFAPYAKHRIRGAISDGIVKSSEAAAYFSHRRRIELERLRSLAPENENASDPISELSALAAALAIGYIAENAKFIQIDDVDQHTPLNPYETLSWRELQLSVMREIERLPAAEKTVVQQHYLNDVPFAQIATLLGVSKGRISQLHRAALERVRDRLSSLD
jgi:RNA polymerase sigma factor for flagellar operon FliA